MGAKPSPLGALPDLAPATKASAPSDLPDLTEIEAEAGEKKSGQTQESLEERRLRLEARRDAIQKKKRDEEEAKARANRQEEQKRDTGDIFRNT